MLLLKFVMVCISKLTFLNNNAKRKLSCVLCIMVIRRQYEFDFFFFRFVGKYIRLMTIYIYSKPHVFKSFYRVLPNTFIK